MKVYKRFILLLLVSSMVLMGCTQNTYNEKKILSKIDCENTYSKNESRLNVLVVHSKDNDNYLSVYHHFNQSMIANINVEHLELEKMDYDSLLNYDVVYLETSLSDNKLSQKNIEDIQEYVKNGGSLFLENEFYNTFPKDFIGAKSFNKIEAFPIELVYPTVEYNEIPLQSVVKDFHILYKNYVTDAPNNTSFWGYGIKPSTAKTLVSYEELSLYTINNFGKGRVFFTNSMLPNTLFIDGYDLKNRNNKNDYFVFTNSTANSMIRNAFVEYISKEKYGYVVKKIYGPYGRPAIAWQNHFEVMHAIKDGAMSKWIDFLKDYNQIPSFSLIRSPFNWGDWKETVRYHINIGTNENPVFEGELDGEEYSSGHKVLFNNFYLKLNDYPEYKSYGDSIDKPYRAYPYVSDFNKDNIPDMILGSADGKVYYCEGQILNDIWEVKSLKLLKTNKGEIVDVGSYSAPILYDVNEDGKDDLVIGSGGGNIYYYINDGNFDFSDKKILLEGKNQIQNSCPDIGDFNNDGIEDLVIGTGNGFLYWSEGKILDGQLKFEKLQLIKTNDSLLQLDKFVAPKLWDFNNDGIKDLIVGTNEGYLIKIQNTFPTVKISGHMEGKTKNKFGNYSIWTGRNTVPFLFDLNNDGKLDLIEGQIEFGFPISIDDELFPHKEELKKEIDYAISSGIEFYPHTYVHEFKTPAQELKELELHKKAFKYYNIPWDYVGTNQHTWRINRENSVQTFNSQMKYGIWWNSGFWSPNSPLEPSFGTEFIWSKPFLLTEGEDTLDMLLFSPTGFYYSYNSFYEYISNWDLPIAYFYHIEKPILNEEGIKFLTGIVQGLNEFRYKNHYNFMGEPQLAKSFMVALKSKVSVDDRFNTENSITLNPQVYAKEKYVYPYENTLGVKFEVGEKLLDYNLKTDADIYIRKGNDIYIGLNKPVNIYIDDSTDEPHITMSNQPIEIEQIEDITVINILDKGLQEIGFYAPNGLEVLSGGWKTTKKDSLITITRYGEPTTLEVKLLKQ